MEIGLFLSFMDSKIEQTKKFAQAAVCQCNAQLVAGSEASSAYTTAARGRC